MTTFKKICLQADTSGSETAHRKRSRPWSSRCVPSSAQGFGKSCARFKTKKNLRFHMRHLEVLQNSMVFAKDRYGVSFQGSPSTSF